MVFAEVGIVVSYEIARDNAFVFSEQPKRYYIYFANRVEAFVGKTELLFPGHLIFGSLIFLSEKKVLIH